MGFREVDFSWGELGFFPGVVTVSFWALSLLLRVLVFGSGIPFVLNFGESLIRTSAEQDVVYKGDGISVT